ncbi:MAG: ketose-bisphosphate aldolase, partial [Desulfobacteraceae bacterium]
PLTKEIHETLAAYKISGAQHGTSGNNSDRLRRIARETRTTKANVATALQMISWGVKVNEYGNAFVDEKGELIKMAGRGVSEEMWAEMLQYGRSKNLKAGDYKKLNLPFENKFLALPADIRERMCAGVEEFVFELLTQVFNARDTAPLAIEAICRAGSYDLGAKVKRIEDPAAWTEAKIKERTKLLHTDKGPGGHFDD